MQSTAVEQLGQSDPAPDVAELHDQYADYVWRSLQRLGVPTSSLEDALQDVFMIVHRRRDSYDASSKISTWLFGISLRVAASYRRRAHVKREFAPDSNWEPQDEHPLANPEHAARRREAERLLQVGLDAMGLDRRAVFVMFEIEGMPASAIAESLGIPIGTVHSRLHKARDEFTRALSSFGKCEGES